MRSCGSPCIRGARASASLKRFTNQCNTRMGKCIRGARASASLKRSHEASRGSPGTLRARVSVFEDGALCRATPAKGLVQRAVRNVGPSTARPVSRRQWVCVQAAMGPIGEIARRSPAHRPVPLRVGPKHGRRAPPMPRRQCDKTTNSRLNIRVKGANVRPDPPTSSIIFSVYFPYDGVVNYLRC